MDPPTQPWTHPTTDTHEDISKNNVVTKTVGPGYPEVIRGTPQIESSSNDSGNSRTNNKDAKIDQVASQIEKSAETSEGHTGALDHASTADPPTQESTQVSCPNPDPDKALEATVKTVDTKTQFRKEDVGPS